MTTIRLNEVTRSVFYAPQYAAIELGFFKEDDAGGKRILNGAQIVIQGLGALHTHLLKNMVIAAADQDTGLLDA